MGTQGEASQLMLYFMTVSTLHGSRRLMAGFIKESGIRPVTTFYLFNLYCVGEIVELNFLLLEIIVFFSFISGMIKARQNPHICSC